MTSERFCLVRLSVTGLSSLLSNYAYVDPHESRICQFLSVSHATPVREGYALLVVVSTSCD